MAVPGTTIRLYSSNSCAGPVVAILNNAGNSFSIPATVALNYATTFTVKAIDIAGNISTCSNTLNYTNQSLEEICDGIDNNGNGQVDEGFTNGTPC